MVNGRTTYVALTEDICEAFMGAVNLEIGDDRTVDFIWKVIESDMDMAETIRTQNNYKDNLMRYFHKVHAVRHDLIYKDYDVETSDGKKRSSGMISI